MKKIIIVATVPFLSLMSLHRFYAGLVGCDHVCLEILVGWFISQASGDGHTRCQGSPVLLCPTR